MKELTFVLISTFVVCVIFFPDFARAIAATLKRHADATESAYLAYQRTWNQKESQ